MSYNNNNDLTIKDTAGLTDGVSIHDGQQALSAQTGDLGGLCTDEDINCYAKYKPVIYLESSSGAPVVNTLDQGHISGTTGGWEWNTNSTWWKGWINPTNPLLSGHIYDCGFFIKTASSTQLAQSYQGDNPTQNTYKWVYSPPAEGQGFRITDFLGYYVNARYLFSTFAVESSYSLGDTVTFSIDNAAGTNDKYLTFADFRTIKNCYFGVVIWQDASPNTLYTKTSGATVEETVTASSGNILSVSFTPGQTGTFKAVPFFAPNPKTQFNSNALATVYPLVIASPGTFSVVQNNQAWINLNSASWQLSFGGDSYSITIEYETLRDPNSGNYPAMNGNQVAVYETTISFHHDGGGIGRHSSSVDNVRTYRFVPTNSSKMPVVINCNDTQAGTASETFTCYKDNRDSKEINNLTWDDFTFESGDYIVVGCKVYITTWDANTPGTVGSYKSKSILIPVSNVGSGSGSRSGSGGHVLITDDTPGSSSSGSGPDIEPGGWDTGQG